VNASIDGFLKKGKSQEAHRILAWAGKFGVYPNVETYNILLGNLIRDDQTREAMALLQHMHKTGIAANSTTFTVILSETFKRSKHYTADEQKQIVDNVFTEMEGAGVKATIHTYGKIIHEMLHVGSGDHGSGNIGVVNAVMERMAREKVKPTAFIYTDFINYYFNCNPADLDGVRSVIERYRSDDDNVNSVFWDLVIKNYAKVGDTASAMRILGQVRDNPALDHPKWATYYVLITALAETEEWDIAKTLVKTLVLETGGPDVDPDPKHWHKRDFWTRAMELKLMES
jgi:pentatricopeptide repeat protein